MPLSTISPELLLALQHVQLWQFNETIFEVDLDAILANNTAKRNTRPLVEVEAPLDKVDDSLLSEAGDVEGSSESDALEETHPRSRYARTTTACRAFGPEDALQSYLRDIRGLGIHILSPAEEMDLAQQAAAGNELARRKLVESNLRLVVAIARRYSSSEVPLIDLI